MSTFQALYALPSDRMRILFWGVFFMLIYAAGSPRFRSQAPLLELYFFRDCTLLQQLTILSGFGTGMHILVNLAVLITSNRDKIRYLQTQAP